MHGSPTGSPLLWIVFFGLVLGLLFVDLFVINRRGRAIRMREAAIAGLGWVTLALLFAVGVLVQRGGEVAAEFLTGYVLELSLSFDNLFVFLVLFRYFGVERDQQHRVLFWGILGALILRALFIVGGAALLERFEPLIYLFGLFLLLTGFKLLREKEIEVDPSKSIVLRLVRKYLPVTEADPGGRFFVVEDGRRLATRLFLCLVAVEASDVVFAIDSIPAIFGVTRDTFVVYTSNVFAILGLRSFFMLLSLLLSAFQYLSVGLALVLIFIGGKMLAGAFDVHVGTFWSLGIVLGILATAVVVSLLRPRAEEPT